MIPAVLAGLASLAPTIMPLLTRDSTAQRAAEVAADVARALTGQDDPDAALAALRRDPALSLEYERLVSEQAVTLLVEETKRLETVNQTIRLEAQSIDPYVRRWRPTFGYIVSLTWAVMFLALGWSMVASPQHAAELVNAAVALTPLWGIALAVLGVQVWQRSSDKRSAAGVGGLGVGGLAAGGVATLLQGIGGPGAAPARDEMPPLPPRRPAGPGATGGRADADGP